MDLLPLVSAFGIIALAELGDKTQIAVMCLSTNRRARTVFIGAVFAFALIDGVSALVGGAIAAVVPTQWIGAVAGVAFIGFGVYSFHSSAVEVNANNGSLSLAHSFSLIALMELGDKTQLSVIALSAEFGAPIMVFLGVMFALTLLTAVGIALGSVISRFIPMRYVKAGSSVVFVVFGILFLLGAITGYQIL